MTGFYPRNILITGAAGFIGSYVAKYWSYQHPDVRLINLDNLTYAGNPANLEAVNPACEHYFEQADVADPEAVKAIFQRYQVDAVMHLAAESHVDRSIADPSAFVRTNVQGTATLLNAALQHWDPAHFGQHLFLQVSTDEVYGTLGPDGFFDETSPYQPRSPYAASKAGADQLVRAYSHTYGLPVKLTNCSNNFGPYQHPEKLIPRIIQHILEQKPLPVYGQGQQIRDWLYVADHARALEQVFYYGSIGQTYLIGARNEWTNLALVRKLCELADEQLRQQPGTAAKLITFVADRAGHDYRYAVDPAKLQQELGWAPDRDFEEQLRQTFQWYHGHQAWVQEMNRRLTGASQIS